MKRQYKNIQNNCKIAILTVDISKSTHYGYLRCTVGEIKPFKISNTMEGFKELWKKAEEFKKLYGLEEVVFGFESTGSYGDPLKQYMQQKGAELIQVNPMHTKRLKELSDNSPNKTDKKDPRVIADILSLGYGLTAIMPVGIRADLRELVQSRENHLEDINRIKNRMEALLARYFPEFLQIMGLTAKTSMYLLKQYTTPEAISQVSVDKLAIEMYKRSRSQMKRSRAETLHEASSNSIGVKQAQEAYKEGMHMLIEHIELLEHQLLEIEKRITGILNQLPESCLLLSVRGVGLITAAYLLSEVVDFKGYNVEKEIIKYAGLNLYEVSSGKHKGQKKISKRGRTRLRKILFMAVLNMVKKGGIYHNDYQEYLKRGMKKIKAMTILMKRLLKMVFAIVKKNEMFIENHKLTLQKAA